MAKKILSISGQTPEGTPCLAGVHKLYGTHGLPLDIILMFFKDNNLVVDWDSYFKGGLQDGANFSTIKANVLAAVMDVYGREYTAGFNESLERYELNNVDRMDV